MVSRIALIGQPVRHSVAAAVQEAALGAEGLDVTIEPMERRPHELAAAVSEVRAGDDFIGAMVASPHKDRVPPLVDALSEDARATGAVNTVVRAGGRLEGHNTDVAGIRAGLTAILPPVVGRWPKQAVVLGAGAAARAVVAVLISSGFLRIAVFNRHLHRAEALVTHFKRMARHMDLRAMPWHETIVESELARAKLLVNATVIGLEEGESALEPDTLAHELFVLDLVLNHPRTRLMDEAEQRGGVVANGQTAFLTSSAASFRLWTGRDAPLDAMRTALATELGLPDEAITVAGD
ncbi:MAG: shikimate dehydrogenase [Chloroflexota bacterium]|nr:shikimate dehydrogenase [Chloroflexota bacterium]